MTLDFIEKRIKEQQTEIQKLRVWCLRNIISEERYTLIKESALSQLEYFESEKQKLIATSNKTNMSENETIKEAIQMLRNIDRFDLCNYRNGEFGIDTEKSLNLQGEYIDSCDVDQIIEYLESKLATNSG